MAESSVSYLLNRFADFLRTEVQNLGDVHGEVSSAKESLERVKAHLQVADSLEEVDHEVEVWIKQIRDAAHDMEDTLDEFKLAFAAHQGIWSVLFQLPTFTRILKARYRAINDLKRATARIESVCEGHKRLRWKFGKFRRHISNEADSHWQDHRGDALLIDKTDLVGIEEHKSFLVKCLTEGPSEREAVSMYGMGGLGKTTLAKQVYDDPAVKKHFVFRVWVNSSSSSSTEVLLKDMFLQIVTQIRKHVPRRMDTSNHDLLKMMIKSYLLKVRYLIVLDDIWHVDKWEEVKYAFPSNECGSRVMVTTRKQDVASASRNDFGGTTYELKPLPDEEAWNLFCRKTFQGEIMCPSNLEETCKSILMKCEGLPLPIIAISGVLASKGVHRIDEWELIKRSLRAEIDGNDRLKKINQVLSLSFKDLPYYLKSCFLLLSVFPEGDRIKRMRLIRLWIAEGFVEAKEGRTLEEVAGDYFDELMNRSLLQLTRATNDGRVKECRIHHLLQQIAIQKSSDQNFAVRVEEQSSSWPDNVRRLSVHHRLQPIKLDRSPSRLRSLYMFGVEKSSVKAALLYVPKLLTVLEMKGVPGLQKFPNSIVEMYFLRYLSLRYTEIRSVPSSIGKLQNLETLDLKHTYVTELPAEIVKLQRLRHLIVYRYENVSYSELKYAFSTPADIGSLQCLQKLAYIDANGERSRTTVRDIGKLTQLRRLCILNLREKDGATLCSSISKLTSLVSLSIYSLNGEEILDLQYLYLPPPLLLRVYLKGRLPAMPHWIPSLQSLNTVHLLGSCLKDDPLLCMQNMPNLVVLELQKVFDWKVLHFNPSGFKKLCRLGLDKFPELRCIEVEEGALPSLTHLIIQQCKLLQNVPLGIEHLSALKVMELFDVHDDLILKLTQGDKFEDFQKVAHVPEIRFGSWTEDGWDVKSLDRSDEVASSSHRIRSDLPPRRK
ncbi:hypothetical protein SAY86_011737 [Trapa natans]|uniref:Disease resistance protein RPM1-like n=1 Tax=Trapa natans TaxID=22666 RepID=A0AAN7LNP5_TRANT|nr:hypothetical protein SAY86_011737 [Trapa natans]